MSISSVSNANSLYPSFQSTNPNATSQVLQNLDSLGTALQSGDSSSAQTALSTLQQSLPSSSQGTNSQPFGNNSQANADYQSLVGDVQSGNLTSAQKDLSQLQTHLKAGHAHGGHHRGGTPPVPTTDTTDSTTSVMSADPESTSGNFINVTV